MDLPAPLRTALARYPLQLFFTVAAALALLTTIAFFAGLLPVTRSIRTFIRLVSLTLVLLLFAAFFWAGPVFRRLLE